MADLLYVFITLGSFAGLALLVGTLDRRLTERPSPDDEEARERDLTEVAR